MKFSYRLLNYWYYLSAYKIIQNLFLAGADFYELTWCVTLFFVGDTSRVCLLSSQLIESANGDHRSHHQRQLNSGTKSDGEECEWEDKGQVECAREVFLLGVPEPRRSEPRRGIKALRAPITLTTRREASHQIDLQGFLPWHSECLAREA